VQETGVGKGFRRGIALALVEGMLVRYCATHVGYFGYPRLLGVRWNGWTLLTAGGLCEACRERERDRWETAPYGQVLIPAPVELGPRTLVRRVVVATLAATTAALVTTAALLAVQPPDLIPSGGEPGHFSSGARLAESPSPAEAKTDTEQPAASRRSRSGDAMSRGVASRVVQPERAITSVATPDRAFRGCVTTVSTHTAHATPRAYAAPVRPAARRPLAQPVVASQAP
jgi:hypothetical protein